jgi:hypothetical protein
MNTKSSVTPTVATPHNRPVVLRNTANRHIITPTAGERRIAHHTCIVLSTIAIVAGYWIAYSLRNQTWDDSAITLGYARTLSEHGVIQFGAHGPRTEGFTSALWMALLACVGLFVRDPDTLLRSAQFISGALYALNAFLIYSLASHFILTPTLRYICVLLFVACATAVVSIADAMENHLFVTLHLAVALVWLRSCRELPARTQSSTAALLALLIVALASCRPEGILTVGALGIVIFGSRRWFGVANRTAIAAVVLGCAGIMALLLLRHAYFGKWLPNTVYAKTWEPYWVSPSDRVELGIKNLVWLVGPVVAPLLPLLLRAWPGFATARRVLHGSLPLALTVILFMCYAATAGEIWGTRNRILLCVMPFAWIILVAIIDRAGARLMMWHFLCSAVLCIVTQLPLYHRYASNAITVSNVKSLMRPAATLALFYPTETWRIAAPDVGATLLYWGEHISIVDTALLNHPTLSVQGWANFNSIVLSGLPPEVIETHAGWTSLARLHSSPVIRDRYSKVTIDGVFFLVRNDIIQRLRSGSRPRQVTIQAVSSLSDAQRADAMTRRHTNFAGDLTRVDNPWEWSITIAD